MATPAIDLPVLAFQCKLRLAMIERELLKIYFPAFRGMTIAAVLLKIFPVRRLSK